MVIPPLTGRHPKNNLQQRGFKHLCKKYVHVVTMTMLAMSRIETAKQNSHRAKAVNLSAMSTTINKIGCFDKIAALVVLDYDAIRCGDEL